MISQTAGGNEFETISFVSCEFQWQIPSDLRRSSNEFDCHTWVKIAADQIILTADHPARFGASGRFFPSWYHWCVVCGGERVCIYRAEVKVAQLWSAPLPPALRLLVFVGWHDVPVWVLLSPSPVKRFQPHFTTINFVPEQLSIDSGSVWYRRDLLSLMDQCEVNDHLEENCATVPLSITTETPSLQQCYSCGFVGLQETHTFVELVVMPVPQLTGSPSSSGGFDKEKFSRVAKVGDVVGLNEGQSDYICVELRIHRISFSHNSTDFGPALDLVQ